jgi:hypothetical protein
MRHQGEAGNKRRIHTETHPCNGMSMDIKLHDKINAKQASQLERQHPHAKGMVQHIAHGAKHHWPSSGSHKES